MYTPLQEEELRQELTRRRVILVVLGVLVSPAVFVLGFLRRPDQAIFGYSAMTIRLAAIAIVALFAFIAANVWRCPGCKERLGAEFRPEKCPNCDAKLGDGTTP